LCSFSGKANKKPRDLGSSKLVEKYAFAFKPININDIVERKNDLIPKLGDRFFKRTDHFIYLVLKLQKE